MQRVKISLLCLLSLSLAGVLVAQTAVNPNADVGTASLQNFSGGATLRGTYFDVRNMTGDGVGYRNGYTQIGAFTPFWLNEDAFIAPNARLIVTDNSRIGANLGAVGRHYSSARDRIYGINGYFDSDETAFGNRYQQATFGIETLGTRWDFRANGYFALGTTDRFLNEICVGGDPYFLGNNIAFLGQQRREESLSGGDFEFGMPLNPAAPWLRGYAGMYGYQSNASKEPIGVRARLEAWVSDDLSIGVNVTDDRQFGTNVNAVVDFRFSGFKPTRYFPQWTTRERMLMPVQRNWRVSTDTYEKDVDVLASATAGGPAYFVTHIDNSAAPGGDGSFEHPFNTLPGSAPGADLILVARGTTTEATPLFGSIVLEDNKRLLGEGKAHMADMFATYGGCVVDGTFVLPGFTNSGNYPFLSSAGPNPIITLANNNEVAAFNLVNTLGGADAIGNTVAGSNSFLLQCLEISGNSGRGINLTQATGTGIIRGINLMSGSTDHLNPGLLGDNINGGIFVDTGAAGLDLTLTNVAMNSNPGVQLFGINLQADNGPLTTTFTNVQANGLAPGFGNTNAGIILGETGQTLTATLTNVSASDNTGLGVQVTGTGGIINLTSDSLTANGNGLDNLQIGTQGAPLVGTTFTGNISDSFFNGSVAGSGIVYSQSAGSGTLNLTNINANTNGIDGLGLFGAAATTMNVNVIDSFLTTNVRDGIHVEQIGGSTINLFVDPTDVRFNGRDGLFFDLAGASTLNVVSQNNLFDNNNRSAIHGLLNTASIVNLGTALQAFDGNTGNLSGADGLFLDANGGSTANLFISNGTFADSGRLVANSDGVHIHSDASTVNLTMTGTPANNTPLPPAGTQRHGLFLDIQNASTFTGSVTDGNFTNSLVDGLHATFAGGSQATLLLDNTSLSNSGRDGMNITLTEPTTDAAITLQNGSLNDTSGQDGLDFNVTAGHLTVTATDSSFTNSGAGGVSGNGILGVINGGGLVNLNFTNTPVTNSLDNGMFVTATNSNIQAVFDNSPLDDNGQTAGDDGVRLVLSNSNNSLLTLTNNSTVNRNADDGIEISATNGTIFTGTFDNFTITDNGQVDPAGNGVVVLSDNSAVGMTFNTVTIGNTVGNATQQIGFRFTSQAAGTIDATFTGSDLSDNTLNAFNGLATGAGSRATVNLNGTVADSSGGDGAVLLSQAGGRLDFNLANASSINSSGATGLVGTVDGVGSILNVSLNGSTINASATFGTFLNATAGGLLNFDGINTSSISNSGGAGVLVTSTGAGSVANFGFDTMAINDNGFAFGGEGFNGAALAGGTLNVCLDNSTVTGNTNQGLEVLVTGLGSVANFGVDTSIINDNASQGLLVNVSNRGEINYRSQNSSYSNNGSNGTFDGVQATVNGTGGADTAIGRFLFSNDTIDTNTGDGLEFNGTNGATLITSIANGTDSTNNAGFGLRFNPSGANTKAYLLMTGANQFSGNMLGALDINSGNITGIDTAVISLSGTFDDSNGDGIHIELTDVANAVVAVQGPGTIDRSLNNGGAGAADNGDGIDIRLTNNSLATMNGSILIGGFTSIDDSAADGIHIELTNTVLANTFNAALEISGIGSIANSGDDAVDVSLIGMTMVNGLTIPVTPITILTLGSSTDITTPLATPLNACLPVPVAFDLNTSGLVPASALTINSVTADNSAARGINVLGLNSTIDDNGFTAAPDDNGMSITNNVVNNSQAGDGLHIDFTNVTGPGGALIGVLVDGNSFDTNSGNGINFDLLNSPIDQLTITNNLSGVSINTGLDFVITGNTFNGGTGVFTIGNTSGPGVDITSFTFDVSTIPATALAPFINYDASGFGGFPFTPFGVTDATTGLATVNGIAVPPYPNTLVPTGSQLIDLTFNDFNSGEQFQWDADLDPDLGVQGAIFGDDLVGATINVNFTGGLTLGGALFATGNPQESAFVATSGNIGGSGIANNGLDGIRFSLNNSSLTNLVIDNNQIESNGTAGTGHGVNFQTVNNSDITNATVSNNTITENAGDGFRLVNPVTAGLPIGLLFQDNTITNQTAGSGIEIQLNNAEVANINIDSAVTGNQISGNSSFGVHLDGVNTAQINLTMGGAGIANLIDANRDAGVGISLVDDTTGSIDVSNSTFSNTTNGGNANFNGGGMEVRLANNATLPNAVIGDPANANTIFTGNASHGISIIAADNAIMNLATIDNIQSLTNTGDGLNITRNGTANFTNFLIQNSTFQGNTADGIDISAQFFPNTDDYTLNNNQVLSNDGRGLSFLAQADAQIDTLLSGNTFNNNGQDGVQITTVIVSPGDAALVTSNIGTWVNNVFSNNGRLNGAAGAGLEVSGIHNLNIGLLGAGNGNQFINNAGDGIEVNNTGTLNIINATVTGNNTSGSADGLAGIDINSFGGNTINVSNSVISRNLGDGVEFDDNAPDTAPTVVTLTDNLIQFNGRDGVEYMESGNGTLNIIGTSLAASQITNNGFRGVDIVAQGSGGNATNGTVNINLTSILANTQEGVNVILTSDNTQTNAANRDSLSSVALALTGTIGASPFLNFNLTNSVINNNGQVAGNIGGSGLNVRVGTTRGGQNFNVAGGFASAANGGVVASVTGNSFSGNFGADVLFESFTSTVNPATTGGLWTDQNTNPRVPADDVFTPSGFQSDPIARLDLIFNTNIGQELNGTRPGASYNNDESVFKSRTQAQDNGTDGGIDDDGPFGSGSRLRNAQRLAARNVNIGGTQLPPQLNIAGSNAFRFPGMGQSTFRVNTVGGNAFGLGNGFLLDTNPYVDFTDANGVNGFGGGPLGIDSMPWGWSVLP